MKSPLEGYHIDQTKAKQPGNICFPPPTDHSEELPARFGSSFEFVFRSSKGVGEGEYDREIRCRAGTIGIS